MKVSVHKRIVSMLLCLAVVFSLAACGGNGGNGNNTGNGGNNTPGSTSEPAGPSGPSRTDLNIALSAAIATADPMGNTLDVSQQMFQWVYDGLVFADGKAEIHPRIAESWKINEDGTQYIFQIRQDVKFHSGDPLTVEDVVFSLNRNCEMSYMKNYTSSIEKVEATGDWEVTITLKEPDNGFLYNLYVLKIVEKKIVEEMGDNFGNTVNNAGTGAYKIVSYDPNTLIKLEKNHDYYVDGTGNIETVNVHIIANGSTRVTALQTGELDFVEVPTTNWDAIKSSGNFETQQMPSSSVCTLILKCYDESSPLYDKRVRQAVRYALDRDAIIQVAAGGLGHKAYVICNPDYIKGSSDKDFVGNFEYNPDKAKELLAEAGYANGCQLGIFLVPDKYDNGAVATVVTNMLDQVGIKTTIEMAESTTAATLSKDGYQDIYITTSNYVHHMSNQKRAVHSGSYKTQVAKYGSAELDSYFDQAQAALTDAEMEKWYNEANAFMDDFSVNVPLYYKDKTYAWNKDLDAGGDTYYFYIQDWSWK